MGHKTLDELRALFKAEQNEDAAKALSKLISQRIADEIQELRTKDENIRTLMRSNYGNSILQ